MPTISRFYGIVILMNFGDHVPPHFHARYGDWQAVFTIDPVELIRGVLPTRAERLVLEWAAQHHRELIDNWERAVRLQPVQSIEPLD